MAEEWRVSLVIAIRGGTIKGSRYRDLLRNRVGDDVAVSADKMHIFLYTGSAKAHARRLPLEQGGGGGDEARPQVFAEALGLGVGAGGAGHAGGEQAVDDEVDGQEV